MLPVTGSLTKNPLRYAIGASDCFRFVAVPEKYHDTTAAVEVYISIIKIS